MPVTYQYENNKKGIVITATGKVDGVEFLKVMNELFSDEETIRNFRYGLNDFTQLEQYNISPFEIYLLAELHIKASKINRNICVGFAINKPLIYGLVRIWMAHATGTGWQMNIEDTRPEIQRWINNRLTPNLTE